MAELAFFRHGEELLRVPLDGPKRIGRSPECDVPLPDPALSRVQALVEPLGDGWRLLDRSGRGTRVGGREVHEARLEEGAEVALGGWRALFRASPAGDGGVTRAEAGETRVRGGPGGGAPPAARLRVRAGGADQVVPLGPGGVTVGKDGACEVRVEDPFVSARHLRVEPRGGAWALVDLGSTNGTFIAGARVAQADLPFGLAVKLGDAELVLEPGEAPAAPPAEAFEGMISGDAGMRQLFELVERVAAADAAVTILGETGTGKELVARALHARSARREGPFIPVNCSAIAASLIEAELFGHEKGAFSGADRQRKGAFEEADGGTIFLDEVGELPLELQPKLLRALELGEVKRVGAARPFQVNVRIVAATHRDLRAAVRAGRFREDLYYRLCVVPVTLPPLRARRGDVRPLADAMLARAAPRGLPVAWSAEAIARLEAYDWPGNVRQLRNVVLRALLFRGEGLVIPASAVTFDDTRAAAEATPDDDALYVRGLTLEDVEREVIRLSLRRNAGKRAAVVKELKIAKSTVLKRIAQWGLHGEGRAAGAPPDLDEDDEG
ncbi:MAG: sigma 54-interacting transcriptional regulator [Anaeromyxobacter sp.]